MGGEFLLIILAIFVFSISLWSLQKETFVAFKHPSSYYEDEDCIGEGKRPFPGEFLGSLTQATYNVKYFRVSGYYYSKTPLFYRSGRAVVPLIHKPDDTGMNNFYAIFAPPAPRHPPVQEGYLATSRRRDDGPPSGVLESPSPFAPSLRTVNGGWILQTSERIKPKVYVSDSPTGEEKEVEVDLLGAQDWYGNWWWRLNL